MGTIGADQQISCPCSGNCLASWESAEKSWDAVFTSGEDTSNQYFYTQAHRGQCVLHCLLVICRQTIQAGSDGDLWSKQESMWQREMERWERERAAWDARETRLLDQISKLHGIILDLSRQASPSHPQLLSYCLTFVHGRQPNQLTFRVVYLGARHVWDVSAGQVQLSVTGHNICRALEIAQPCR